MENSDKIVLATLNVSDDQVEYIKNLPGMNCDVEHFNSPEGMIPWLKHVSEVVVVIVNADVLLNQGHNEIDKLIDLFNIEPILNVNPVIAVTSRKSEVEHKILEKGFAADILEIPSNPTTSYLRIKNLVSIYKARYKVEKGFLENQERENRKKLLKLQEIDKETGIFNREAFSRRTEEMIRSNPDKKYVLIRWDIDRFKIYNDTFGVHAGDALLRAIGKSYIDRCLQSVTYGHWVSDHFVMCMEEKMFSSVAVHKYISEQISLYRNDFEFIVRMGVFRITDPNVSVPLMCDRAFMAMKSIKNDFEHRIAYYDDAMRGQMMEEQELITDMEPAIQNKEFQIYFQPQYNYATGKMSGAEALVRWNHPKKGMISPAKFIPVFEQNGFICRLDQYIWERVCQSIRQWKDNGFQLVPVSVNISRRDIYNPILCSFLEKLIKKYDIEPELLRLEITESAYMEEPTQLIKVVEQLQAAGFIIEMDDFGSGYSSLNTLKDVPVDILKLDLRFLSSEGTNKRGGSILTSVVRMANWLTLPIIAEGIENIKQAEFLKSIGCYIMQGYLFSRPIPEDEFLKLMDAEDLDVLEEDAVSEDLSNAVDFLNLSTQNALLFNSFVGGAAIVECSPTHMEAIRINDKFFDTIKLTREEYAAEKPKCLGFYSVKYEELFRNMLEEAKQNQSESDVVLHWDASKKTGLRSWIRYRARYLASAGDGDIYYVAVENITDYMHLLHENENMNRELMVIMDTVPCGIITYVWDGQGTELTFANKPARDMFGLSEDEYIEMYNTKRSSFFVDGDFEKFTKEFYMALKLRKTGFEVQCRVMKKNSTTGRVFFQGTVTYDGDNANIVLVLLDLTQQLEGDITKFSQILNKVYDEVFEVNYETGEHKLLGSNYETEETYEVRTGVTFHERLTEWIKNYVAAEDKKKVALLLDYERIQSIQATGEVPHVEYDILLNSEKVRMSTTLMQIDKKRYLVCNRKV